MNYGQRKAMFGLKLPHTHKFHSQYAFKMGIILNVKFSTIQFDSGDVRSNVVSIFSLVNRLFHKKFCIIVNVHTSQNFAVDIFK